MFPDLIGATVKGKPALENVSQSWYEDEYIPAIQQRGAAIIAARGSSSAASAANAAVEHVREWIAGSDAVTSMGIRSSGEYGVEEGVIFSYPVTVSNGTYHVAENRELNAFARSKIEATEAELIEERDAVAHLL